MSFFSKSQHLALAAITILTLSACEAVESPTPSVEPTAVQVIDPLDQAREELFNEIGVSSGPASTQAPQNIPIVLPTLPPELPATDADLEEFPVTP